MREYNPATLPLAIGTRLGPYEILSTLGVGGMGEVYRARDTRLDRQVAVKILPPHLAGDPLRAARFAREARAVAALSHPNVLGIFDVGEHAGVSYVVTELLEGTTLRERLGGGALPLRTVIGYALQIVDGLSAAHDKGIVHRDLKPENLFVTSEGRVKILDFGLARQSTETAPAAVETRLADDTEIGTVLGTAGYMAPEQARGLAVDHRADIFAFGAILFEMLSGRRAFRGDTTADTMAAVVRDEPPDLGTLNPAVSAALARTVSRCLAKDPSDRFRSTRDLGLALDAISGAGSSHAVAVTGVSDAKAVVVLPFENISPDPDNEFFADGLTEEIISDLSKISGLRVISRTSSMQLKGRQAHLPALVRELNVQFVLEGSVRKAGDRLRISAQLIDVTADAHLWSEKYNGSMEDVFDIQERVARAIASELRVKLTPEESREIAKRPIADPAAYECYLRARAGVLTFDEDGIRRALQDVEQGLALAGDNVLLLSVKGEAEWQSLNMGITTDPAQLERVRAVARRLEAIEPGSHHADRLWGLIAALSGQVLEAFHRLRRSLAADPRDTLARGFFIFAASALGRAHLARPVAESLLRDDPLEPFTHGINGWLAYLEGRFDDAVRFAQSAHALMPKVNLLRVTTAQALAASGRVAEATAVCGSAEEDDTDASWLWVCRAFGRALRGESDLLLDRVSPADRAWAKADPQACLTLAECGAMAGRADLAFEHLEAMLATGAVPYEFLASLDPLLARVRTDPRWPDYITRVRQGWERVQV